MSNGFQGFRGALFGGFNRRDVLAYFERFARENNKKIEELSAALKKAEADKATLAAQLDSLRCENGDCVEQEARVRASLEESTRSLTNVRGELQETQSQLVETGRQLSEMQEKVTQLEPLAQRYEALKDRVATVELDAHQKAQATIDAARAEAEAIRADTVCWLGEVKAGYDLLRGRVRECAEVAARTEERFAALDGEYQELLRKSKGE